MAKIKSLKPKDSGKRAALMRKNLNSGEVDLANKFFIPVSAIEIIPGSKSLWIHSTKGDGGTILRVKCTGKINIDKCHTSHTSHFDLVVIGDIDICVGNDAVDGFPAC